MVPDKILMQTALESVIGDLTREGDRYTGAPLDLATFWLLHHQTYLSRHVQPTPHHQSAQLSKVYDHLLKSPLGLESLDVNVAELETLQLRTFAEVNANPALKDIPRNQQAREAYDGDAGYMTFGPRESFWEAAGAMELAQHDYIVIPQALTGDWTGTARPDGTAFRLGEVHRVLADIGLIPGGATLPEIELRSFLDERSPTSVSVDHTLGVIEAKKRGNGADGVRELASHRAGTDRKKAYLDFPAVDRGWLVCPDEWKRITNDDRIGGVTWNDDGVSYIEPPTVDVLSRKRSPWIAWATDIVLTSVLRYQDLPQSLAKTVEICRDDPTRLYEIV